MKTCQALFNQCLAQLSMPPSELDEADRAVLLSQIHELENECMRETLCSTEEIRLNLVAQQREYKLPQTIYVVDEVIVNDSPVSRCSADEITRLG
jgi:hypothetical protein